MNKHQVVLPKSSSNGYGRRKGERETAALSDSKIQIGKSNSSWDSIVKGGLLGSPSRDQLMYLASCLIGHQVEVHVMDGSVYSAIFHATNAKDFGIVLKMAQLIKDGSQGQKNISDPLSKPPSRTLIIPSNDLIQVTAKEVPVTRDGISNDLQCERQQEILTDSCISQSLHVEMGRELERWVPDENEPSCPDLENIFDSPWKRGWDQFEVNATLFGVKSTFNEEIYTTKLERGPQMRELEKEATRIAREIEGEDTLDLHLAEERGIQLDGNLDIDEETRFSSVYRPVDDSGFDEIEDITLDSRNDETFGDTLRPGIDKPLMGMNPMKTSDATQTSSRSSKVEEVQSSVSTSRDVCHSGSEDHGRQLSTDHLPKESSVTCASRVLDNQCTGHAHSSSKEDKDIPVPLDRTGASEAEDSDSLQRLKKDSSDKASSSPYAGEFDSPHASSKGEEKVSSNNELSDGALPSKAQVAENYLTRPSSYASSTSDRGGPASTSATRGLSSSSSVGSLSSEKSSLNPHAKEFKLNPNAKSFIPPSQTSLRPLSPVAAGPFYYPPNVAPMTQMHGMPIGIGPPFPLQQPVIFNPHAAPVPQPYYHPNGPQFGQQMMIGQPRPVLYMPYPAEMPYKGREF